MKSVSIQIPTMNSASTLPTCLESISKQDYDNIETIVIDSGSHDRTTDYARESGAHLIDSQDGLLWSRIYGIRATTAEVTLLIDSDQILKPTTVTRAVSALSDCDMSILVERAESPRSLLARLYDADRVIGQSAGAGSGPIAGVQMPRAFRTTVLKTAVASIPRSVPRFLRYPDHAIIYFECCKLTNKLSHVDDAITHIENTSWKSLISKHFGYGKDARSLSRYKRYRPLILGKQTGRSVPSQPELFRPWLGAQVLLAIKASSYICGFLAGTPVSANSESSDPIC